MSLGVSATAAAGLSKETLAKLTDDPEEEVPRLGWHKFQNPEEVHRGEAPPEIEPEYYTISRDKWTRVEGARKVAQNLSRSLTQDGVAVGLDARKKDGLAVGVKYVEEERPDGSVDSPDISLDELRSRVPASQNTTLTTSTGEYALDGVPVTVEKVTKRKELRDCGEEAPANCYFDDQYRPVGAGCEAGAPDNSGCAYSLGPTGWSTSLEEYVITTAGHAVSYEGETINQPSGGGSQNNLGDVSSIAPDGMDAAVIQTGSDASVTMATVSDGGGMTYGIYGMVTQQRINDMMDSGEGVYHQGRRTGGGYGEIDFHAENNTYPWMGYAISTDGGDSGSITYELINNDEAYVVALHTGGYCNDEDNKKYGSGECMYSVQDEMNLKYSQTL